MIDSILQMSTELKPWIHHARDYELLIWAGPS